MSKAENLAKVLYPDWKITGVSTVDGIECSMVRIQRVAYIKGYHQAEEDLIDKTLLFLKDRLYKDGYVGIIDLCDDYIKAMKDDTGKR